MAKLLGVYPLVDVVAVAPTCGDRYFLVYNLGWEAYTFPMTKRKTSQGEPPVDEEWMDAARRVAAEILVPDVQPAELRLRCDFANYLQSGREPTQPRKRYHFHVYDLPLDREDRVRADLVSKWLTPDEARDPDRWPLSPTVQRILSKSFPLRGSRASWAVISRQVSAQRQWLAQWNERWGRFHFVGGHKELSSESHLECVTREVEQELSLRRGVDFTVAPTALDRLEYTAWSEGYRQTTAYEIELFAVQLSREALARVDQAPNNRWLTETEIAAGRTNDGRPISDEMRWIL